MKSVAKETLRIGKISYLNCVPFYYGLSDLEGDALQVYEEVPVKINQAMRAGEIDVAPISSLEYLNHQEDYYVLPDIAIGARDFSGSVLLFSNEKIETLNDQTIALSEESYSSVTLLKILLEAKLKYKNQFVVCPSNPEKMLADYKAALVIGDDALFYNPEEFIYKYDLSELWWSWTAKPFCFALWAVRKEFADQSPERVNAFYGNLKMNLAKNLLNIEELIKNELEMDFLDERFTKVFGYLFNLSYGFDESMEEGLKHFYELSEKMGAAPVQKEIEFFKI